MTTTYVPAGEEVPPCRPLLIFKGAIDRDGTDHYEEFSSDATAPGAVTGAEWIGDHDNILRIELVPFEGRKATIIEIPRERVASVERWRESRDRDHEWSAPEVDDGNRRYLDYMTPQKYPSGYLTWCEGCDTAREATTEEIMAAGLPLREGASLDELDGMRADGAGR